MSIKDDIRTLYSQTQWNWILMSCILGTGYQLRGEEGLQEEWTPSRTAESKFGT